MSATSPHHPRPIALAEGDGVGPEITKAVVRVLRAAEVPLIFEPVELGARAFEAGHSSGITPDAWKVIRQTGVLLKAPLHTPQGGGYKSVNVTLRKALGLFANVRPCKAYTPFIASHHPGMNLVIVRENEEDLYAGIEHQQTSEVAQVLKLITEPGAERVVRYAFDYARAFGRRRVTCMTKDNIMKITDGLFHRVFDRVAEEYPDVESGHEIIDIGAARVATQPERYDVIVAPNLYGDILSDIAAEVAGSIGLASSANIGSVAVMFEAVHGTAPDIAGKDVANPSGLLLAAVNMLVHLGLERDAERIKNAWLCVIEDGLHTTDMYHEGTSQERVGTSRFAEAVIERLGRAPKVFEPIHYGDVPAIETTTPKVPRREKVLMGVDVFLDWDEAGRDPDALGPRLEELAKRRDLSLTLITNRGVKVYPDGLPETHCTDHWRCRFKADDGAQPQQVVGLLGELVADGLDVIKTENLYEIAGERAYSLGQGE